MDTPLEMDNPLENMHSVVTCTRKLIDDVYDARNIFFQEELRSKFEEAYVEFSSQVGEFLDEIKKLNESVLRDAGLSGKQGEFKYASFDISFKDYKHKGTIRKLIKALKKGKTVITSLAGVMPFASSFMQEFIEFMFRQLEKES